MKLRVGGTPTASMETRELRAQHAGAVREIREHRGRCVACEQAARRKRNSRPCGPGLELRELERDLKAKVKESVALDAMPIPGQETLWHTCPTCSNPVDDPREVCEDCLQALGALARPSQAQVSAEEFAAARQESEQQVRRVMRQRREITVEWKLGQICWVCDQRRKCCADQDSANGWICRDCLEAE